MSLETLEPLRPKAFPSPPLFLHMHCNTGSSVIKTQLPVFGGDEVSPVRGFFMELCFLLVIEEEPTSSCFPYGLDVTRLICASVRNASCHNTGNCTGVERIFFKFPLQLLHPA